MTIAEYCKIVGTERLAEDLEVSVTTLQFWRSFRNCPKPENLQALTVHSDGKLTYENMIEDYLAFRKPGKQK